MRAPLIIATAFALASCAEFTERRVDKYGDFLDVACRAVTFDSVVVAVQKRPELAIALPLLCPATIGTFMAIANQPRPATLNINLVEPTEAEP